MEVQQPTINWDDGSLAEEWSHFEQHVQLMFIEAVAEKTRAKSSYDTCDKARGAKSQEIL